MENGEEGGLIITSFHRIIMPSVIRESRLVLPKKFVDEYGDELSETLKLSLPLGVGWYVGLKRCGVFLYLSVGWEKFMKHYSIRLGHFLLFKYRGNSEFDVHIFHLTATEIRYLLCSSSDHMSDHHTSEHALSGNGCCSDVKLEEDEDDAILLTPSSRKRKAISDPALAAAEMYETVNPFLIVKLKEYNVKHMLYLPVPFTREHMKDCPEFIEILDSDNMKWLVRVKKIDRGMRLSTGWTQFVKAQGLKTGDVCVFEMIAAAVMKVSVFHEKPQKLSKSSLVRAPLDNAPKCRIVKISPDIVAAGEMYKTENPFFIVKLKDYNVNRSMLYMPRTFTREHMKGCSDSIEILDSHNKNWPVLLYKNDHDHDRMMLSTGWRGFVKAEGLSVGDVCVFELIAAAVLKVSVFHAKP